MSTKSISVGATAYVVRNRNGKFLRAYLDRSEADKWLTECNQWTVTEEVATEPDSDGYIIPLYKENNQ